LVHMHNVVNVPVWKDCISDLYLEIIYYFFCKEKCKGFQLYL